MFALPADIDPRKKCLFDKVSDYIKAKSFEPKCREVCTDEEYRRLKEAFFEKEINLSKGKRF